MMVLLQRCRLDGEALFGSSCPRASPSRAKLDLPDGKSSGDASGIVEPKLHRALFPSSRRDSGEGTRHSALQNAKEARTLLISLVFIPLHRGLASFSFFPPHRSPSLPLPTLPVAIPFHHIATGRLSANQPIGELLKAPFPQEPHRICSDARRWTPHRPRASTLSTVGPWPLCELRYS